MEQNYNTACKVSKYGFFSCPYFPGFSPNTWKYGPGKTLYLDTFHPVIIITGGTNIDHNKASTLLGKCKEMADSYNL